MFAFFFNIIFIFSEAAGHGESEGGILKFYNDYLNIPGFEFWKFLNLAIFIAILVYLVKKPLSEAFKIKRDAIRAELIRAEKAKQAALSELTSAEAKLAAVESEKAAILKRAREEAEAEKANILAQTESEIGKLREQAESEINRLIQQTKVELRRFSAEESVRIAEEKLRGRVNADSDAQLVKASIQEIGGLN